MREWRAGRLNLVGQPIDDHVSTYGDLQVPPDVGTPGGLSFSYDFEIGIAYIPDANGVVTTFDLGQHGSANETNVTSALWDVVDGPASRDETPGADDDGLEVADAVAWDVEHVYLPSIAATNPVTVEDFFQGWFARNGPAFHASAMNQIFVGLAKMPFAPDAAEPDNGVAGAGPADAGGVHGGGGARRDQRGGPRPLRRGRALQRLAAQDLTGWQIEVYVNGTTNDPTRVFTFPTFTLRPGRSSSCTRGRPLANGDVHLYGGSTPGGNVFNISWNYGLDGAVVLRRPDQTPVDFVRWRDANGVDNTTPTPPAPPTPACWRRPRANRLCSAT